LRQGSQRGILRWAPASEKSTWTANNCKSGGTTARPLGADPGTKRSGSLLSSHTQSTTSLARWTESGTTSLHHVEKSQKGTIIFATTRFWRNFRQALTNILQGQLTQATSSLLSKAKSSHHADPCTSAGSITGRTGYSPPTRRDPLCVSPHSSSSCQKLVRPTLQSLGMRSFDSSFARAFSSRGTHSNLRVLSRSTQSQHSSRASSLMLSRGLPRLTILLVHLDHHKLPRADMHHGTEAP
jgi:hypothetical protein